ncbi:MAG TPA: aminoacetone oxidase family FAD-binding enzyme [Candidatus Desulfovibrio intestinipullorum]|uniref:Aminoacetone oxidase family FAD-binding enzyme n=1 Tax=Candidatus Desulfovibrio intestinipullorum TaxID=2838536 RepID=A0A9D1PW68_9BACT|nr:aminoacetone oxidase family FAD-binding enzyme [Candidatus Desulfovibrio intestinipullorum]
MSQQPLKTEKHRAFADDTADNAQDRQTGSSARQAARGRTGRRPMGVGAAARPRRVHPGGSALNRRERSREAFDASGDREGRDIRNRHDKRGTGRTAGQFQDRGFRPDGQARSFGQAGHFERPERPARPDRPERTGRAGDRFHKQDRPFDRPFPAGRGARPLAGARPPFRPEHTDRMPDHRDAHRDDHRPDRHQAADRPGRGTRPWAEGRLPGRRDEHGFAGRPDRPQRFERSDRPERSDRFERADRFDRSDRPARRFGDRFADRFADRSGAPFAGREDKAAGGRERRPLAGLKDSQPDRSVRPERPDRSERPFAAPQSAPGQTGGDRASSDPITERQSSATYALARTPHRPEGSAPEAEYKADRPEPERGHGLDRHGRLADRGDDHRPFRDKTQGRFARDRFSGDGLGEGGPKGSEDRDPSRQNSRQNFKQDFKNRFDRRGRSRFARHEENRFNGRFEEQSSDRFEGRRDVDHKAGLKAGSDFRPDRREHARPFGDRPGRDRDTSFGDRSGHDRSFHTRDRSFGDRPDRDRAFGDRSFGERSDRDRSFGDRPGRGRSFRGDRPDSFRKEAFRKEAFRKEAFRKDAFREDSSPDNAFRDDARPSAFRGDRGAGSRWQDGRERRFGCTARSDAPMFGEPMFQNGRRDEAGFDRPDSGRRPALRGSRDAAVYDVLILGAGAAGLMCAAHLVSMGLSVCVVDRSRTPGRKLSVAGGGRANFSNRALQPGHFVCSQTGFVEPVLEKVDTAALLRLMDVLELPWEEKEKGKLFLQVQAADLVRALIGRCRRGDFTLCMEEHFSVDDLSFPADPGSGARVRLTTSVTARTARHLVLALGSPASPFTGSSGFGYALAQSLGHSLVRPRAALAPFFLEQDSPFLALKGVSVPVRLSTCGHTVSDDLLFTHMGLSGPAALKASLYWQEGEVLEIDLLPKVLHRLFEEEGRKTPRSVLGKVLPQRLVDVILPAELAGRRCSELKSEEREQLEECVHCLTLKPVSVAGLRQAEVCAGGVDCSEIEPVTFASRRREHVSIIGEMLDVTGTLGGYNLHWAFASALLAAQAIADSLYPGRRRSAESQPAAKAQD